MMLHPTLFLLVVFPVLAAPAADAPSERQQTIAKLIAQLGSDDFDQREEAQKQLGKFGEEALPALEKAFAGDEAEIRRRAEILLTDLRRRLRERAAEKVLGLANKGGIDVFADYMAARNQDASAEDWAAYQKLTATLVEKAGKSLKFDVVNWTTQPVNDGKQMIRGRATADEATSPGIVKGALAARGPIRVNANLIHTVIFANGNVTIDGQVVECVIVCDGDVTVGSSVIGSVIVANGAVKLGTPIESVVAAGGSISGAKGINSKLTENETNPLGVVKFFDPSQMGITAVLADGKVRVESVAADGPLARAGLKKGDVVTALDDVKVDSLESFRTTLRQRVAEGRALFHVQRGEKSVDLPAKLLD